jgi:hypothetical protein
MFLLLFALAAGSGGDVAPAARDTALSAVDPLIASSATIRALESAADDDDGGRATTTMLATKAKSPLARAIATWQGARRPDLVDDGAFDRLGIPHAVRCRHSENRRFRPLAPGALAGCSARSERHV